MSTTTGTSTDGAAADEGRAAVDGAAAEAEEALARLDDVLAGLGDGDLHLASPDGGWTSAQLVSHICLAAVLWVGDVARLQADPGLRFFFREEIGHDVLGYPPPTAAVARAQVASTRRTLATCLAATPEEVLGRTVEVPDLGTRTVAQWSPLVVGHLTGHVDQVLQVLRSRGALTEEG